MARLPRISSEPVLTRAAQSSLSASDIADPYKEVASSFGALGTMLEAEDADQAGYEGTDAVYRDEAGTLKLKENPYGKFGRAANSYERAAMQALTARVEGDIRSKGAGFAEAAKGDVEAFTQSWKGFRQGLVKSVPKEARGSVEAELDRVGQQFTLGISEQKRKRDLATFEGDLKAEAQLLDDEASALARGGGTSTPEYAERMSRIKSLYSDLAANPDFSVGEKEAEVALRRIESRHVSESIVGSVDRTLTEKGAPAARSVAKRILEDESLSLSPAERRQYAGIANERINGWLAQQKVALEPVKDKAKKLTSLLDDGVGIDSPDIDDTVRTLARGGDTAGALDLVSARAKARTRLAFQGASNEEQASILQRAQERANAGTADPAAAGVDVDSELVKDYRTEVTADAKDLWGDIKSGMEKGLTPDSREVDLLSRQLALINDNNFSREVNQFFESDAGSSLIASLPTDQATQIIDALKSDAVDGATVAQQDILASAQRAQEMKATALKADPVGYAVDKRMVEAVPALDPRSGPDAMGSALMARQRAVDLLRARGDVGNVSALRPEDQRMLGQFIQTATPREQADLLGGMSRGLKPETFQATLGALYAREDTRALATAGVIYRDNPEVAEAIIRGRRIMAESTAYVFEKTDLNRESVDAILPSTTFPSGMERVRGRVLEAARARYADLSFQQGDPSGKLNDERMQQAINEVTGGTLEFNGVPTIAPRYGMSQDDFDAVMNNLSDSDLAGAMTADGQAVTARHVRLYGRLRAVGTGQYLLEFGAEHEPTYAMKLPDYGMHSDADRRGAFVLSFN